MRRFSAFINRHALFVAIVVGAVGFPFFRLLTPALPTLIFLMLFFTFCKVNPLDLRLHKWHVLALIVQMSLTVGSYFFLRLTESVIPILQDHVVAEGVMLCFLQPTATAAAIIAGKLGGSIQNLTMYTIISNLAVVLVVPLFFPYIHPVAGFSFAMTAWTILKKVGGILVGPFALAWALRIGYDTVQRRKGSDMRFNLSLRWAQLPFYLWTATIVILMGDIVHTLVYGAYSGWSVAIICIGACPACLIQFHIGRAIGFRFPASSHGKDYRDVIINPSTAPTTPSGISRITAGQALGQKNTTLAIWMAQTYLFPLAALGPAAYMIIQNLFIARQIQNAAHGQ
ncbi:MAG: hypothetical protein J6Y00_06590 [Paludibacteraceae bacterium]|nr:hypothetical protein [Paludibacteraceae bacterium]